MTNLRRLRRRIEVAPRWQKGVLVTVTLALSLMVVAAAESYWRWTLIVMLPLIFGTGWTANEYIRNRRRARD